MRRRDFIKVTVGSAAAWPLTARAQQPMTRAVGFLNSLRESDRANLRAAFRRGLGEAGYVDGRNVTIEYRYADDQYNRLPALAADLISRNVVVIAATGGGASVKAAMAATKSIPIVFTTGGDAVQQGYVASLNRPGGNVTGVSWFGNLITGKGLGLLHELLPKATLIAMLLNPKLPESARMQSEGREAAPKLGQQILILNASSTSEIDAAFATMRERRAGALLIGADPFFSSRSQQIVALAARDAIPILYTNREFVEEGGLMSYGNDTADAYRRAGVYVGRILNGASPADLPVDQATKFEFVINLKTAKTLGVNVPPELSARADEVIE
jgi:putative tryptophan/tyrosine transport system substrate-binding protein